jgi:hypothetical protein
MRRVLFDTNIVLDVLLDREPHVEASAAAWAAVESGAAASRLHAGDGSAAFANLNPQAAPRPAPPRHPIALH